MIPHCFPFSSLQGKLFLSPRTMAFFHRHHRRHLSFPSNLSISLLPTTVTTRSDCFNHRQFNTKPLYFHHLSGGMVSAVHEEASLNENEKRTAIHHWSLVPKGRLTGGSVTQMIRYIYAPPQNRPSSGDAKYILPLTGDAAALAHGWGVEMFSLKHVCCDTGTITPHRKWLCILHAEHPQRAPPPKKYG